MSDRNEIIASFGILLVIAGIACYSWRAAIIVSGLLLFGWGYQTSKPRAGSTSAGSANPRTQ